MLAKIVTVVYLVLAAAAQAVEAVPTASRCHTMLTATLSTLVFNASDYKDGVK